MKILGLVPASILLSAVAAFAQDVAVVTVRPLTDDDIKLMRQDVQSMKEGIIKDTMQFTDAEGTAFWPVYKLYATDQKAIGDRRVALITDYAKKYDTLTDDDAKSLTQRMLQIDDDTLALRKKYLSKFQAAIGGKRAAMFYQVDNRLSLIVNVQLASVIPLVHNSQERVWGRSPYEPRRRLRLALSAMFYSLVDRYLLHFHIFT